MFNSTYENLTHKNLTHKNISLSRKDIYKGNLILVNKDYPLISEQKCNLIELPPGRDKVLMEKTAGTMLRDLLNSIKSYSEIIPVSGYRTKSEQEKIFNETLEKEGVEFTRKYVAIPQHSEHQTGLAIDLSINEENIDFITPNFPYEGICNQFRKKAPLHGFIERYQAGKEHITNIAHEPWHFRYVSFPHSKIMYDKGLCLEEYIDFLKDFPYEEKHLTFDFDNIKVEIFYVKIDANNSINISLPQNIICQISGNNVDGCIVSLWGVR